MPDTTDRLALPLIAAGQAQKEVAHNEALTRLAMLVQPVVVSAAPASVPGAPAAGQCWIVGTGATGAWAGQDGAIACWTSGGWRFVAPTEGMQCWSLADSLPVFRKAAAWQIGTVEAAAVKVGGVQVLAARQTAISGPAGGSVIDVEARVAINAILAGMRAHGLIAT